MKMIKVKNKYTGIDERFVFNKSIKNKSTGITSLVTSIYKYIIPSISRLNYSIEAYRKTHTMTYNDNKRLKTIINLTSKKLQKLEEDLIYGIYIVSDEDLLKYIFVLYEKFEQHIGEYELSYQFLVNDKELLTSYFTLIHEVLGAEFMSLYQDFGAYTHLHSIYFDDKIAS